MKALSPSNLESPLPTHSTASLRQGMRKHAGIDSARVATGDDVASSIAAVPLPDDNPDESAFPLWPVRTER